LRFDPSSHDYCCRGERAIKPSQQRAETKKNLTIFLQGFNTVVNPPTDNKLNAQRICPVGRLLEVIGRKSKQE
jgi:iron-sulfur cluster repair protein YtfE (RIC family)